MIKKKLHNVKEKAKKSISTTKSNAKQKKTTSLGLVLIIVVVGCFVLGGVFETEKINNIINLLKQITGLLGGISLIIGAKD